VFGGRPEIKPLRQNACRQEKHASDAAEDDHRSAHGFPPLETGKSARRMPESIREKTRDISDF